MVPEFAGADGPVIEPPDVLVPFVLLFLFVLFFWPCMALPLVMLLGAADGPVIVPEPDGADGPVIAPPVWAMADPARAVAPSVRSANAAVRKLFMGVSLRKSRIEATGVGCGFGRHRPPSPPSSKRHGDRLQDRIRNPAPLA
jgi:hypothetical protein